ncbi:mechanosensitive ion channel family protein [Brevibacillus fulvus]|nr:mechanosensitive ion channel family protein [Brevibacillus fulvus]
MEEQNFIQTLYTRVLSYLTDPNRWELIFLTLIKVIVIIVAANLLLKIIHAAVNRIFGKREGGLIDKRRIDTLRELANNGATYLIYFVAILLVVQQFGFDLRPLLVSAGVLGLAIGFGAQSLVRDVITGFFILFEDQFAVGDTVTINNFTGTVETIGLRITRIKSWTGEIHIIPNGSITQVTNFSLQNSIAVVDVSVAYEEDLTHVEKVLAEVAVQAKQQLDDIVKEPQVLGVQAFGAHDMVIRMTAECNPNTHFAVARKLRAMIKAEFEKQGIEIPYPKMVMANNQTKQSGGKNGTEAI